MNAFLAAALGFTTRGSFYLSGPTMHRPDWNFSVFNSQAARLRKLGYDIINPAEHFAGRTDLPREVYRITAVEHVLRSAGLIMLPSWRDSREAVLEVAVAQATGKPVYALGPFNRWGPDPRAEIKSRVRLEVLPGEKRDA